MNAGWLELPRSSSGSSLLTGTYRDGSKARNYTYLYDKDWYSSMWIAYPLYASTYSGSNKYSGSWAAAQGISSNYQINIWTNSYNVYLGDTEYSDPFSTSGKEYYARGHQIPDADRQYNQTMVQQTYFAINSTPQIQNKFNGGIWQNLEQAVRTEAGKTDTLYVATGPVFQKVGETQSVKWILPRADTKLAPVPNYYWKVLLKVKRDGNGNVTSASTIGFWFEHKEYDTSNYADYAVSVDQIEAWTGFDLFTNLPGDNNSGIEKAAEANTDWTTFQSF